MCHLSCRHGGGKGGGRGEGRGEVRAVPPSVRPSARPSAASAPRPDGVPAPAHPPPQVRLLRGGFGARRGGGVGVRMEVLGCGGGYRWVGRDGGGGSPRSGGAFVPVPGGVRWERGRGGGGLVVVARDPSAAVALGTNGGGSGSGVADRATPPLPPGSCVATRPTRQWPKWGRILLSGRGWGGGPQPLFVLCCALGWGTAPPCLSFPVCGAGTGSRSRWRVPGRLPRAQGSRCALRGRRIPTATEPWLGAQRGGPRGSPTGARARGSRGCRPRRQVTFLGRLLAAAGAPALYCTRRWGWRCARQGRTSPDPLGA